MRIFLLFGAFFCFSFLVGRFKPLNLQSAVQLAHEDVSSGSRMNR